MIQVLWALGFISLGMAVSEVYHRFAWKRYQEGIEYGKHVQRPAPYAHYASVNPRGGAPR